MIVQQFPNGLSVIYEKSNIPITSINIYCKLGSVNEPDHLHGVSHMIEHMCFKGTKNHPTANSIFNVSIGSEFNAYTDKFVTCYYMQCLDKNIHHCVDILSDVIFHSFFHKADYENEKNVVKEENIKNADELDVISCEETESLIFKGTPYANSIDTLDYHKDKKSLPRKSVYEYYKKHYIPSNIVISIHSSISVDKIMPLLKKSYFYKTVSLSSTILPMNPQLPNESKTQYKFINKDSITTYISIGFLTCSYVSPEKYSLEILSTILSGGMNSYIFTLLRDKNGLTYSSDVDTNYFKETGSFSIYTEEHYSKVIHNSRKKGVLPLLIDAIRHFVKNGITKKQLSDAKEILQENMIRDLQYVGTKPEHNAIEYIMRNGEFIEPYDSLFEKKYKNITISDVNYVIRKYFTASNMNVCLVGNHLPSLETVQRVCTF
jgi:predicted Zn-dependent peptidase